MTEIEDVQTGQTAPHADTTDDRNLKGRNLGRTARNIAGGAALFGLGALAVTDDDGRLQTPLDLSDKGVTIIQQSGVIDFVRDWLNSPEREPSPGSRARGRKSDTDQHDPVDQNEPPETDNEAATPPPHLSPDRDAQTTEPELCTTEDTLQTAYDNGTAAKVFEFYFDNDSSTLSPADIGQGAALLNEFSVNADITGYAIGCADTTASVSHNALLAQNRAYRVTDLLAAFGLQAQIVGVSGGEACPTVGPDETVDAEKRRTTVFLHQRAQSGGGPGVTGP